MGKGKTLTGDLRNMVLKVMNFFEEEKRNKSPIIAVNQAMKRTAMATGVSERTLRNIKQEVKRMKSATQTGTNGPSCTDVVLTTPRKRRGPKPMLEIDEFMLCGIKNIVNDFYNVKKEIPTIQKILSVAKEELNFPGQRMTLWRILKHRLGFKLKKTHKFKNPSLEPLGRHSHVTYLTSSILTQFNESPELQNNIIPQLDREIEVCNSNAVELNCHETC